MNYHNVTPPELMEPWDHHLALGQARAQSDLEVLAPRTTLAVADSGYNETHLAEAGFAATAVIAPSAALRADGARSRPESPCTAPGSRPRRDRADRRPGSPSAGSHPTSRSSTPSRPWPSPGAGVIPTATLRIIGKPATDAYDRALRRFVAELGLLDAVSFEGHASDATVAEAYATSDVLVVASEHEGFCVPVVEAMAAGLPVVAFDQGAIPEVLGDAGLLVTSRDPYVVADTIADLLADGARRADLAHRAQRRVTELQLDTTAERFVDLLVPLARAGSPRARSDRRRRR